MLLVSRRYEDAASPLGVDEEEEEGGGKGRGIHGCRGLTRGGGVTALLDLIRHLISFPRTVSGSLMSRTLISSRPMKSASVSESRGLLLPWRSSRVRPGRTVKLGTHQVLGAARCSFRRPLLPGSRVGHCTARPVTTTTTRVRNPVHRARAGVR